MQITAWVRRLNELIEEFHREIKQLMGIEAYQCRKSRIQLITLSLTDVQRIANRQNF